MLWNIDIAIYCQNIKYLAVIHLSKYSENDQTLYLVPNIDIHVYSEIMQ